MEKITITKHEVTLNIITGCSRKEYMQHIVDQLGPTEWTDDVKVGEEDSIDGTYSHTTIGNFFMKKHYHFIWLKDPKNLKVLAHELAHFMFRIMVLRKVKVEKIVSKEDWALFMGDFMDEAESLIRRNR